MEYPSAFPYDPNHPHNKGMSLRDYFAGQALSGMMAASSKLKMGDNPEDSIAWGCYFLADAMLEAREE